jgi:hypothetical protein
VDVILISVTAVALALTAGMAIVVATMLRDERARSDARVAALSAMTREDQVPLPASQAQKAAPVVLPSAVQPRENSTSSDDLEIRPVAVQDSALFALPAQPSPWGARLGVIAAILVATALAGGAIMIRSSHAQKSGTLVAAQPASEAPPLELLALSQSQEGDRIVISGLVQNPRNAGPRTHVVATAFVFGPGGAFLSSGRAPIDFTTLTPGEESRFVVSVPVNAAVARYRIGFRTEDGQVLPHVDKRAPDALAQK